MVEARGQVLRQKGAAALAMGARQVVFEAWVRPERRELVSSFGYTGIGWSAIKLMWAAVEAHPRYVDERDIQALKALGYRGVNDVAQRIERYNATNPAVPIVRPLSQR